MRFSIFCFLLFLPGLALSQPIDGPYVVIAGGENVQFKNPHVVFRDGNLADIFYVQIQEGSKEVLSASFSLTTHQLISSPGLLFTEEGWNQSITDAENQSDGSWAIALYSTSGSYGAVVALIGTEHDTNATELERASDAGEYYRCWVLPQGVSKRSGGGWVFTWTRMECGWPFYEHTFLSQIAFFRDTNPEDTIEVYSESCLFGPPAATTLSVATDSVLILVSGDENSPWLDGSLLKSISRTSPALPCDPWEGDAMLPCTWSNLDFQRTQGGRLLVFSGIDDPYYPQYPHPRIVEVDTSGNCTELFTLDLDRDPDAIAWHPDYGFAALLVHPARIMLARVDTNGVEIQPLGIFWEPESGYRIAEANLRIANDGRVVVFWNEMDAQNLSTLKIGSVGWDTFLGVQEKRTVVLPEEMSLSVYPNPFNLSATISFELPQAGKVSVVIYDVTGRRVRLLANEYYGAGRQHLKFDATGFSSGIYFARLEANGNSVSKKLLLLK